MVKVPGDLTQPRDLPQRADARSVEFARPSRRGSSQLRRSARRAICILAVALMAAMAGKTALAAEQAGEAGQSCSKYLPTIGRTVAAPCEPGQTETRTEKTGDLSKLPLERLSLRVKLGRAAEGNSAILGVRISDVVPPLAKLIEITNAKVFTNAVVPQSAAELAGVRPGDIILTIGGLAPKNAYDLSQLVRSYAPGSEVTIELARVSGTDLVQGLRDRADAGSIDAMMALAPLLRSGVGAIKSDAEAARWYRKAAELGNADAMDVLGSLYESGVGFAKDEAEAARWYRKAADLGSAVSMGNLADLYVRGGGVAKDDAEAARWYRKAAELGHADAMNNLGTLHALGRGVAKDEAEAARWYRKGADLGSTEAMSNLGDLYVRGGGVAKDAAEAVRLYRKAADSGNAHAMRNLGILYYKGDGMARDNGEAVRWIFSAVEKGDTYTVKLLTDNSEAWSVEFRKALQDRLRQAGVYSGASDGTFGPSVKDALAALAARAK